MQICGLSVLLIIILINIF